MTCIVISLSNFINFLKFIKTEKIDFKNVQTFFCTDMSVNKYNCVNTQWKVWLLSTKNNFQMYYINNPDIWFFLPLWLNIKFSFLQRQIWQFGSVACKISQFPIIHLILKYNCSIIRSNTDIATSLYFKCICSCLVFGTCL